MKAHYRNGFRQAIVEAIETDDKATAPEIAKRFNLLSAMEMLEEAWSKVRKDSIVNCWRKAGFSPLGASNQPLQVEEAIPVPPQLTKEEFDRWVDIDEAVDIAEELTEENFEEQLVSRFQPIQAEPTLEPEEEEEAPTAGQMRAAIDLLERGLQASAFPDIDSFRKTTKAIREHLRVVFPPTQLKIDSFFQ